MKLAMTVAMSTILLPSISLAQQNRAHKQRPSPKITYVQLEREPCLGTCPWYTVILRPDGKILYFGGGHVEHIGAWTAKYWGMDFDNLVRGLGARKFRSMQSGTQFFPDAPVATITVGYADGKSKTVTECEIGESHKHWELTKIIDGIVAAASDWKVSRNVAKSNARQTPIQTFAAPRSPSHENPPASTTATTPALASLNNLPNSRICMPQPAHGLRLRNRVTRLVPVPNLHDLRPRNALLPVRSVLLIDLHH